MDDLTEIFFLKTALWFLFAEDTGQHGTNKHGGIAVVDKDRCKRFLTKKYQSLERLFQWMDVELKYSLYTWFPCHHSQPPFIFYDATKRARKERIAEEQRSQG